METAANETCSTSKSPATTRERAEEKAAVASTTRKMLDRKKFERRRATLKKQANGLRILCGCQVAIFCIQPDGEMDVWQTEEGAIDNTLNAYHLDESKPKKRGSNRGKQKRDSKRRKGKAVDNNDSGAEPVASGGGTPDSSLWLGLGLGLGQHSWETSNCSDMEASRRLVALPLLDHENYDADLIDLDLRLGFD